MRRRRGRTPRPQVDAFLFQPSKTSLAAIGTSNQPLSMLQRQSGLDVLPLANGGRVVEVFETNAPYRSGDVQADPSELKGIREVLHVASQVGVPIEVGGERRGVLMVASLAPDFFTEDDERFAVSIGRWVGMLAHHAELIVEIEKSAIAQGRRAVAEELLTTLAHDVRNFIQPIGGRIQLVRRRAVEEGRPLDVRDTDAALRAVERLGRLVADLLDVARLDQGLVRFDSTPIDLTAMAREVASTLATTTHEVRVLAAVEVLVLGDEVRLKQCVENLVANAVRHSPRGAPVTIEIGNERAEDTDIAYLDVVDEGPGVPETLVPRIFDRFTSGENSGALGLGLFLAKQIALGHRGELEYISAAGRGARFRLRLPLLTRDEPE